MGGFHLVTPKLFGWQRIDPPPFFWLQGMVTLSALLMTTLVLITANRQTRNAEERSHLDLQVNLLAEHKVAKLIALVEELRRDLPMVRESHRSRSRRHARGGGPKCDDRGAGGSIGGRAALARGG